MIDNRDSEKVPVRIDRHDLHFANVEAGSTCRRRPAVKSPSTMALMRPSRIWRMAECRCCCTDQCVYGEAAELRFRLWREGSPT